MRTRATLALLLLLSGCSGPPHGGDGAHGGDTTVPTTLEIRFSGEGDDVNATLDADLGSRPSLPRHEQDGAPHPGFYSAHDHLAQWSQESGVAVEVAHSSFGYYLARIGGVPEDTAAWYWSLAVDGTDSVQGMGGVQVREGTRVTWTLTPIE